MSLQTMMKTTFDALPMELVERVVEDVGETRDRE